MNDLERARLESRPIELADKVLGYLKLAEPDTSDSMSVAEWQRKVNDAALLREIVGQFVAGMDGNEVLAYVDSIVTAQSIYAMPSQTELLQLRESVAGFITDAERYRHVRQTEAFQHLWTDAAIDQARGKGVRREAE